MTVIHARAINSTVLHLVDPPAKTEIPQGCSVSSSVRREREMERENGERWRERQVENKW